ncbi:MAG: histone deacetylase [Mariniblastus sp.]|nr:histone deacetylase [Mariniblastus sp.]
MQKYRRLREEIERSEHVLGKLLIPPAATNKQLLRVHTQDYVERVIQGDLSDLEQRRIGFPWSEKMVERSRRSVGATIAAARSAYRDSIGLNLAGGTHHAFADNGQGYCVFNDVCVAIRSLQANQLVQTALVVDCDVHQGNGTSSIAADDPTIFTLSIHCEKNYPFKKTNGDLDIALPAGTSDAAYLHELETQLAELLDQWNPDMVFYLAGADPYEGDRLGLLELSKEGLRRRDAWVISNCRKREIPIAICMAGGYADEVEDIVDIHFATVETAYQQWRRASD